MVCRALRDWNLKPNVTDLFVCTCASTLNSKPDWGNIEVVLKGGCFHTIYWCALTIHDRLD